MNCPYCDKKPRNYAGLTGHIRIMHSDKWKKTLKDSIPKGFDIGEPDTKPKRTHPMKGKRKTPLPMKCPWCNYSTSHPPGLVNHIKGEHPGRWRDNLGTTLGREPSRRWKTPTLQLPRTIETPSREVLMRRKRQKESYRRKRGIDPIVYSGPDPGEEVPTMEPMAIKHCPSCGFNLHELEAALAQYREANET